MEVIFWVEQAVLLFVLQLFLNVKCFRYLYPKTWGLDGDDYGVAIVLSLIPGTSVVFLSSVLVDAFRRREKEKS